MYTGSRGAGGEGQRAPLRRDPAGAGGGLPAAAARHQEEGGEDLLLRDHRLEEERPGRNISHPHGP